jgi:hypothetical protein
LAVMLERTTSYIVMAADVSSQEDSIPRIYTIIEGNTF